MNTKIEPIRYVYRRAYSNANHFNLMASLREGKDLGAKFESFRWMDPVNLTYMPRNSDSLIERIEQRGIKVDGSHDSLTFWAGEPSRIVNKRVDGNTTVISNWNEFKTDKNGFCGKNIVKILLAPGKYIQRVFNKLDSSREFDVIHDKVERRGVISLFEDGKKTSFVEVDIQGDVNNIKPQTRTVAVYDPDNLNAMFMDAVDKIYRSK